MGRKKASQPTGETMEVPTEESVTPTAETEPVKKPKRKNNTKLVELCLNSNGWDYKPRKIQEWLQKHHNLYLKTAQISTIKSTLTRRRMEGEGVAPVEQAPAPTGARASAPAARGGENLSVEELRLVKHYADRVGAKRFRELIDLLCP